MEYSSVRSEEPVCYQSKFRTGRPALTWTELSTFYGLVDIGARRLVFTNCDEIARVAEERLGAIFVRGSDLDRLTAEDFQIIEAWLAERPATPKKKDPKPHQVVALNDIVAGLTRGPRATALMACGSGKTLVALWAAERLGARSVLILLPSLALVRQTLHEWLHETNWPGVQFLCVCSDPTVQPEEDSLLVRPSDLDFVVTTQDGDVRRFLERPTDLVRLVFSTYQSSHVVAAAVAGLPPFDFGVFDEAHKTAGRDGQKFALALKDENLPITRRLFLTATPRHYDVARKDKFGESKIVFSMDVPEVYGPVVHRLSFSAAAKAKPPIITDYKVIISVVTSEMVTNEALRLGVVLIEGDEIKARQVANQIALKSAIEKYRASKVFTFHSRVASAKSFTAEGPEGISTHLDGFQCAYIEGAMTTVYRERLLSEFAAAPKAILSNARCLTEGVDVPAVDMVAFMSQKRSLVGIVQATGRAMRLSPETGKEVGYVLVPLYVEKARGETVEQAVLRSNFDEVWKVLQGLKEQDDLLAQIIAAMRIERGSTGGFDDSRFRERVEVLCPELSLGTLRETITAACIDAVGENWFERFGQLEAYKREFGDCDMPARWPPNQKLATWVVDQRVRNRDGRLEPDKVELLNQLGFSWNPREKYWRGSYLELVRFQKRFGHCRVPQNWRENNSLAYWVKTQRSDFAEGVLHPDRIALLNKLGFEWVVERRTWDLRYSSLCEFKERFGHTRVPAKWKEDTTLGGWVATQRWKHRKRELTDEQVARLEEIGFEWDARPPAKPAERKAGNPDEEWRSRFEEFRDYAAGSEPAAEAPDSEQKKRMDRWALYQRKQRREGKLSQSRIDSLDGIGFAWGRVKAGGGKVFPGRKDAKEPLARSWDEMYYELVDFFTSNGHCNVPYEWAAQPGLGGWVESQRRARKNDQLTSDQVAQMDELGFAWTSHDAAWDAMFAKLVEYLRPMNNGKPRSASPGKELQRWMLTQRQAKKRGKLDPVREERLTGINFDWDPYAARWDGMYSELRKFHAEHGHCRVPAGWTPNSVLANWVGVQRARNIEGKLSAERQEALNALGFSWRLGDFTGTRSPQESWNRMLEYLRIFHSEHGHSLVPQVYAQNPKLGWWVTTQRRKRRKGKLTAAQIAALDRLGFNWAPLGGSDSGDRWQTMFEALKEFRERSGHCRVPAGWKENPSLANWVATQRGSFKSGRLSRERAELLESIGFEWGFLQRVPADSRPEGVSTYENLWQDRFSELAAYKREHGDCRVPSGWAQNPKLANWVGVQRMRFKKGKLSMERIEALDGIGFDWIVGASSGLHFSENTSETAAQRWNEMFENLREYQATYGDCRVPQRWKFDRVLADWVTEQRMANNRGALAIERVKLLDELGFDWDPNASRWEERFRELLEFKKKHGHVDVSQRDPGYEDLARWVKNQRRAKKNGGSWFDDRARRLEEIGFQWKLREGNIWEETFERLVAFRDKHGHCNVPQRWDEDKELGRWVNTQRIHYRRGDIKDADRIRRLEEIGFVWNTRK